MTVNELREAWDHHRPVFLTRQGVTYRVIIISPPDAWAWDKGMTLKHGDAYGWWLLRALPEFELVEANGDGL